MDPGPFTIAGPMYSGKIITLRPFEPTDLDIYRQWVNDPALMPLLDRILPVTQSDHQRWYEAMMADSQTVIFAVEYAHHFVGCVWLYAIHARHLTAEVRILLGHTPVKGMGTDALVTLARFAFDQMNLHKLYAYVLGHNPRAARAFEKAGFSQEGIFKAERFINGVYIDVLRLGLLRESFVC